MTRRPIRQLPAANPGQPVKGDWVVQQIGADPDSPESDHVTAIRRRSIISGEIFEGLLQMNNYTLKLEPCLALTWEISPDKLTYTFHLRHDVTWQDGAPFTAADVKYTYDRIQDPEGR